ncbi:MAG TPA: DUF6798 domain-containing protein [Stellaceae bacterium]|nr:DUF6798 domain-containing protein [Stellaceae bacterium]
MAGAARLGRNAAAVAALFLVLLCLMPPDGVLSDNEENYFQLALQRVSAAPADTAVFDSSHHRFLADHLLGALVALAGFAGAQVIARSLAALAYAAALAALFRRLGLRALDAILAVVIFALLGQTLFGGEWLFGGAEAKVPAYVLVIAGLVLTLDGKRLGAALLFAAATYFHFLVGIFWFGAAMLLAVIEEPRALRSALAVSGVFSLLVAPLLGWIAWSRFAVPAPDPSLPTPDILYSFIRAPHHMAPFIDWPSFRDHWLEGYLLAVGMLVAALVMMHLGEETRLRRLALWLALLIGYLVAALAASFVDRRTGVLGKFYLFRPAALLLLLWLAAALAALVRLLRGQWPGLRVIALALVMPAFLLDAATRVVDEIEGQASQAPEKRALAHYLRANAPADALVLIDPALDFDFLDFERRTGHPMLVTWKFDPTTDPEIQEWYRRMEFRKAIFAEGCAGRSAYRVDFLLTTAAHASALADCGPVVFRTGDRVLLRWASR